MKRVTLPTAPATRCMEFERDGKFVRVLYRPVESQPDRRVIAAQAFEMTADGNFAQIATGAPSRVQETQHTLNISSIGDTHTLLPGWVREQVTASKEELPEGYVVMDTLPETGNDGDLVFVDPIPYRWDKGMVQTVCETKAEQMFALIKNSEALLDFEM